MESQSQPETTAAAPGIASGGISSPTGPLPGQRLAIKRPRLVSVEGPLEHSRWMDTAQGRVHVDAGDYILTDVQSKDSWPIKADKFAETYHLVKLVPEPMPGQPSEGAPCGLADPGEDVGDPT